MSISCCRECCTSLCQSLTSCCQALECGCAGAGVLSEGGLGSGSDALGQTGEVAAQPCSSATQVKQQAAQVLLRPLVALLGRGEIFQGIVKSFLKVCQVGYGLARAVELRRCLLVLQPLDLQPQALALRPPCSTSSQRGSHEGCGKVRGGTHSQYLHHSHVCHAM